MSDHSIEPAAPVDRTEKTPPAPALWHEYANLFPMLPMGEALDALREDIRANGVLEPIVFLDGKVLDGRHRYTLARELGIEYPRVEYTSDDPLGFVIAKNLHRRQLSESQRAMVASKLAKIPRGGNQFDGSAHVPTQSQAALAVNVSERSVRAARVVQEQGIPDLAKRVEAGEIAVSAAAQVATLPPVQQEQIVAAGADAIRATAKTIKTAKASKPKPPREPSFTGVSPKYLRIARDVYARGKGGDLIGEIALALQAEREACAVAAEGFTDDARDWVPGSLYDNLRRDVAAAIRKGAE